MPGLLGGLRASLSATPSLAASSESAAALAAAAAGVASRLPLVDASHFGAIAGIVVAAAPPSSRQTVGPAVVQAVSHAAPLDARAAVRERVVADVALASGLSRDVLAAADSTPSPAEAGATQVLSPTTGERAPATQAEEGRRARRDVPAVPQEARPLGVRAGSFTVYPVFEVAEIYDTNIFATSDNEIDDFVTLASPSVRVESNWKEHELNFQGGTQLASYSGNDAEDTQDYYVTTDGRFDFGRLSNVFGGVWFSRDHEDRESPDDVNGVDPTTYDDLHGHLGTFQQFGRVALRIGGTFQTLDFDDVDSVVGVINNDDRDRSLYTAGGRLSYLLTQRYELFAQGAADIRNYRSSVDDLGFQRESDGYRVDAGLRATYPGLAEGEVAIGYLNQDYDDARFSTVTEPVLSALATWFATADTSVTGFIDQTIEETTLRDSPGFLNTAVGARLNHDFTDRVQASLYFSYNIADYEETSRDDDLLSSGVGVKYLFTPNLYVEGDYGYRRLDSSVTGEDFTRSLFFLRIGGQL